MPFKKNLFLQHRSKEGVLEYKKSEGVRKVWKPYSFKVSASTYLLYFKSTDVRERLCNAVSQHSFVKCIIY